MCVRESQSVSKWVGVRVGVCVREIYTKGDSECLEVGCVSLLIPESLSSTLPNVYSWANTETERDCVWERESERPRFWNGRIWPLAAGSN